MFRKNKKKHFLAIALIAVVSIVSTSCKKEAEVTPTPDPVVIPKVEVLSSVIINGATKADFAYRADGKLDSLTYRGLTGLASNFKQKLLYNSAGQPEYIMGKVNDQNWKTVITYNTDGTRKQMRYVPYTVAFGDYNKTYIKTDYTYDAQKRVTQIVKSMNIGADTITTNYKKLYTMSLDHSVTGKITATFHQGTQATLEINGKANPFKDLEGFFYNIGNSPDDYNPFGFYPFSSNEAITKITLKDGAATANVPGQEIGVNARLTAMTNTVEYDTKGRCSKITRSDGNKYEFTYK